MKKIAVYAGSFDPVTNGHMDIIIRAAALFDEVVVAVSTNPNKHRYTFSDEDRVNMIVKAIKELKEHYDISLDNVKVISSANELTVNICKKYDAPYLVRGLRSITDYAEELNFVKLNQLVSGFTIETVFLQCSPALESISSSFVKEMKKYNQPIDRYVPHSVVQAYKLKEEQNVFGFDSDLPTTPGGKELR